MATLATIEGIGPAYAEKMAAVGVKTTGRLLKEGGSKAGRRDLAERSGVSESMILGWVNRADLMRVKGVGEEYSDLLEHAGVDTCKELKHRNAENLHAAMLETASQKNLVRRPPSLKEVTKWIAHAKTLQEAVTY